MPRRQIPLRFQGDPVFSPGEAVRITHVSLKLIRVVPRGAVVTILRHGTRRPDYWLVRYKPKEGGRAREFVVAPTHIAKLDVVEKLATLDEGGE